MAFLIISIQNQTKASRVLSINFSTWQSSKLSNTELIQYLTLNFRFYALWRFDHISQCSDPICTRFWQRCAYMSPLTAVKTWAHLDNIWSVNSVISHNCSILKTAALADKIHFHTEALLIQSSWNLNSSKYLKCRAWSPNFKQIYYRLIPQFQTWRYPTQIFINLDKFRTWSSSLQLNQTGMLYHYSCRC
jgi:hypothetical protein